MDSPGQTITTRCDVCEEVKPCHKTGPTYQEANGEEHFEWVLSICRECLDAPF